MGDLPEIILTNAAISQIELILAHDPTVQEKLLRLTISGKGCDGPKYSLGFDKKRENDLEVMTSNEEGRPLNFFIIMDPFCSFYFKKGKIEFIQDFEKEEEGFVITNDSQEEYKGKFWLKQPEKDPEHLLSQDSER